MDKIIHSFVIAIEGGTGGIALHTNANLLDRVLVLRTVGLGNGNDKVSHTVNRRFRTL